MLQFGQDDIWQDLKKWRRPANLALMPKFRQHTESKPPLGADRYYWAKSEEKRLFAHVLTNEEIHAWLECGKDFSELCIPLYASACCMSASLFSSLAQDWFDDRDMGFFGANLINAAKECKQQDHGFHTFLRKMRAIYEKCVGSIDNIWGGQIESGYIFDFYRYRLSHVQRKLNYKISLATFLILTEQMKQELHHG